MSVPGDREREVSSCTRPGNLADNTGRLIEQYIMELPKEGTNPIFPNRLVDIDGNLENGRGGKLSRMRQHQTC